MTITVIADMSHATRPMRRALTLARRALGTTSPNPAVGAVVMKDGVRLGEGHTLPPGQSHAEIVALGKAGSLATGASLYTTMEPCCIQGRTPPCTKTILAAGIGEVHVAARDPNPLIDGRGIVELEAAGVRVVTGDGEQAAADLYRAFAKHIRTGLPHVTAKFAMSLDGKIATSTGESKWITGHRSRRRVHQMRRRCDAVMVGVNTVLRDDPQLTARGSAGDAFARQPLRVVVDGNARTPAGARMLKEPGSTLIAVVNPEEARLNALRTAGAEVLRLPAASGGGVDMPALMQVLGDRGVVDLLVEGGGKVLGSLFDAGLVDCVASFIAPVIIGGAASPAPVGGAGVECMARILRLGNVSVRRLEGDILVVGYLTAGA